MSNSNNTIAQTTEVELNEGLFIVEMEDRLETVEFASAATNSICRDSYELVSAE